MTEIRTITNSFNGGEISPLLEGRTDNARFFNSLKTCSNWLPLLQGGLRVRGGFKYAGAVKTAAKKTYLYGYVLSATQAYMLEFGDLYIRFWSYDATTGEPTQLGAPFELTTTYTEAQLPNIEVKSSASVIYITHASHPPRRITRVSDTNWLYVTNDYSPPATYEADVDLATTMYSSAATGAGRTLTLGAANALPADVGMQVVTDDGGRAFITAVPAGLLTYTVDILEGSFKLVAAPYASGEWDLRGVPRAWLKGSPNFHTVGVGETTTISPKESDLTTNINSFRSGDVGKYLHFLGGTYKITVFTSAASIDARCINLATEASSTVTSASPGQWTMESDSWTAARGYPNSIALGEQRVWFAGAAGEPDTVRGTVTGDYYNLGPGDADDMACIYVIGTEEVNVAQWLHYWKGLVLGTLGNEITIRGSTGGADPLTPTSVAIAAHTAYGSESNVRNKVGNALLFVERSGRRVRELLYNYLTEAYEGDAEDLTVYADHLTLDYTFTDSAYLKTPSNTLFYLRSEGTLAALLYSQKHKVSGWSRHSTVDSTGTSVIESIASIPNPVNKRDELWATIKRTINGSTVRYIEVYDPGKYLDCSKTYSGVATATITGLSHLAAESVQIRGKAADGIWRIYPAQTVSSNQVTGLSPTVTDAEVGLKITATAVTPRLEVPGQPTLQGRKKSFGLVTLRCYDTPVLKVGGVYYKAKGIVSGYAAASVFVIPTGTAAIAAAAADGDLVVPIGGYDTEGRVTIVQDLPIPSTLTMLTAEVAVGK